MVMQSFLNKIKAIALIMLIPCLIFIIGIPPSYGQNLCTTIADQRICLLDIKRSAKNYWEYRLKLTVDQTATVTLTYDCRDRRLVKQPNSRGPQVNIDATQIGQWLCERF